MSSLRSQLGRKLSYKTKDVVYQDKTFKFGGYPSSSLMLETTMPDTKAAQLAILWNAQFRPEGIRPAPEIFKAENIGQIKAVLHYAIPDEGEDPYTLTEIAEIFATDPGLFGLLYGSAMTIMTASNIVEVAAGNSLADVPVT